MARARRARACEATRGLVTAENLARRLVHLGLDVSTVVGSYVPERRVAIGSKRMPCVWRNNNQVARFRDDVNAADGVDTAPFADDEDFAARVTMLGRAAARRTVADCDRHSSEAVLVAVDESNRSTRRVFEGADI
jgi:hypothetical protein